MKRREALRWMGIGIGGVVSSLALNPMGLEALVQEKEKTPAQRIWELKFRLMNDMGLQRAGITKEDIISLFEDNRFQEYTAIEYFFKNNIEKSTDSAGKKELDPEKKKQMQEAAYKRYNTHLGIEQKKIKAVEFYKEYEEYLIEAEKIHGLDRRYNVATLAIETDFGKRIGLVTKKGIEYKAFNSLASIYAYVRVPMYVSVWKKQEDGTMVREIEKKDWGDDFAFPHIKYFLLYSHRQKKQSGRDVGDVLFMPSSYAGCVGNEQFTGESLFRYGIGQKSDFTTDLRDLKDSIFNVAYYYKAKGWKPEWNHINHLKNPEMLEKVLEIVKRYNTSLNYGRGITDIANNSKWTFELESPISEINFKNNPLFVFSARCLS